MEKLPPMPRAFTKKIAERKFYYESGELNNDYLVEVGLPVQDVETVDGFDWRCQIRVVRNGEEVIRYCCGIDSYQALFHALEIAEINIKKIKVKLEENL